MTKEKSRNIRCGDFSDGYCWNCKKCENQYGEQKEYCRIFSTCEEGKRRMTDEYAYECLRSMRRVDIIKSGGETNYTEVFDHVMSILDKRIKSRCNQEKGTN